MKNPLKLSFFSITFCLCLSCDKQADQTDTETGILPEGQYEQAIGEFDSQEPAKTYLLIRDLLSKGDIKSASELTTHPEQFVKSIESQQKRIGEERFRKSHATGKEQIILHSAHHKEDQSLLVLQIPNPTYPDLKAASFFLLTDQGYRQIVIGESIQVNPELNRKFYEAKGEPDAILRE